MAQVICPDIIFKTRIDVKIGTEITEISILARYLWDFIVAIDKIIKLKKQGSFGEFLLAHHLWTCVSSRDLKELAPFQKEQCCGEGHTAYY